MDRATAWASPAVVPPEAYWGVGAAVPEESEEELDEEEGAAAGAGAGSAVPTRTTSSTGLVTTTVETASREISVLSAQVTR